MLAPEKVDKLLKHIQKETGLPWHWHETVVEVIDNYIKELKGESNHDCRNCDKWKTCGNGEKGHANGTSIGYSIGECRDYVELKGDNK